MKRLELFVVGPFVGLLKSRAQNELLRIDRAVRFFLVPSLGRGTVCDGGGFTA